MKNMKAMVCPKNIKINSKVSHVINPVKQREKERERAGKMSCSHANSQTNE